MAASIDLSNAQFPYPRLEKHGRQIRLLNLHGMTDTGILSFTLNTVSLDDEPHYYALSYMCGVDPPIYIISVNGSPYKIRANLHAFLNTVAANSLVGKALFIDAVAINQADLAERSSQVRLMRDVYLQASEVIAWLGAWAPHESAQMPSGGLRRYDSLLASSMRAEILGQGQGMDFALEMAKGRVSRNKNIRPSLKQEILGGDRATLVYAYHAAQRPFWTRLWIVQELMLARRLKIQIGDASLDPDVIYAWALAFSGSGEKRFASATKQPPPVESGPPIFRPAIILARRDAMSAKLRSSRSYRLYELLTPFAYQLCEEPRDSIFGLLGLVSSHIIPDYRLSLTQLYLHVWIEGLIDIVQVVRSRQPQDLSDADPSLTDQYEELIQTFHLACVGAFRCSGLHPMIQLVTRVTLQRHGLPGARHLITTSTLCGPRERPWSPTLSLIFKLIQLPRLLLVQVLTGRAAPDVYLTYHNMIDLWSYKLQSLLLAMLRVLDCEMAMPDGEVRTYQDWVTEVHRVSDLVETGIAPVPLETKFTDELSNPSKRWPRSRAWKLFLQRNSLYAADHALTISLALALAWLGVQAGPWLSASKLISGLGLCVAAMILWA